MSDEKNTGKPIKVIDRRWFTPEGELREDLPATPASSGQASPSPTAQREPASHEKNFQKRPKKSGTVHLPANATFFDLVNFFAQQAVALLSGQVPGRGQDPDTARFFIDLLGVIQEKTTHQLSLEESRYLDDVLFQLRALYVQTNR